MSKNKKSKVVIRILNPLPGGSAYTNHRRASEMVRAGRAERIGPYLIKFVHANEQRKQLAAEVSFVRRYFNPGDLEAGGMATLDQIRGLPCIAPEKLIRDGCERYSPRAPKCGPVVSFAAA